MASRGGRNNVNFERIRRSYQNTENFSPDGVRSRLNPQSNKIFVTHFPTHFVAEDLGNCFNKIGTVTNVNIVNHENEKRYGFVTFTSVEEAETAINEYHSKPPMNLVVNYAKSRDDAHSTISNEEENGSRSPVEGRQQWKSNNKNYQNNNEKNKTLDLSCVCCGKSASCRCSSCGIRYCSQKCQTEDWPSHKLECANKLPLTPLSSNNIQSQTNYTKSPNKDVKQTREPSVHKIVKEITTEYKQSCINNQSTPIISASEMKLNKESVKNNKSPMLQLLNKFKKAKAPPKKPWETTEILPSGTLIEVSVVHLCKDSAMFYAILVEKQDISLDIMTKANEEAEYQPMTTIEVGSLCLVSSDDVIYRGVIEESFPIAVRLLDFGHTVGATEDEIFVATDFFGEFPAQAICMVPAPGGIKKIQVEEFENILVKYTGEMSGKAHVVHLDDDEYEPAPPQLKKEVQTPHLNPCRELLNTSLESVMDFSSKGNVKPLPPLTRSKSNIAPREELSTNWTRSPVLPDVYTKVYVTYIEGPEIYVNIYTNLHNIANTQLVSANNNSSKRVLMHTVSPGRLCIVPFEGHLYRAQIKSVNPITAYLLDYGNTVTVSPKEVFWATNVQASAESQAIHVRLAPGSKRTLYIEEEVNMKAVDKVGDVFIAQVEGDVVRPLSSNNRVSFGKNLTSSPCNMDNRSPNNGLGTNSRLKKAKMHALDYLEPNMTGKVFIKERPCSDKFCINLNTPELVSLYRKLVLDINQFMKGKEITDLDINDEVIVEMRGDSYRGKVLTIKKDDMTYVSLTDVGKVVRVNKLFSLKTDTEKQHPPMAILGRVLEINGDKADFESHIMKNTPLQFQVTSVDKVVTVECGFTNTRGISFLMELSPWEPTFEQLRHGRIFYPDLYDCTVVITHFIDPNAVFVREFTSELDNNYKKNLQNIARYAVTAKPLLTAPMINEIVLAKFTDGVFYKGIVKDIQGDQVLISYLAFGNSETVGLDDLRQLSDELKNVNLFVRKVALAEVSQDYLTTTVFNMMTDIINSFEPIEFQMTVDKNDHKVYLHYPDGKSLNKRLSHLLTPMWQDWKDIPIEQAQDELINQQVLMRSLISTHELPIGGEQELCIVDVTNLVCNVFFACPHDPDEMIATMIELPTRLEQYAETINIPYNPRIDELCIAQFTEEGGNKAWFRGYCLSHEGDECYIGALDMGILQYIPIRNIRRMTKDFIEQPALAIICSIQGMPDGPFPAEVMEILRRELVPCKSVVKFSNITKEDGGYSVRLPKHIMDALLAAI